MFRAFVACLLVAAVADAAPPRPPTKRPPRPNPLTPFDLWEEDGEDRPTTAVPGGWPVPTANVGVWAMGTPNLPPTGFVGSPRRTVTAVARPTFASMAAAAPTVAPAPVFSGGSAVVARPAVGTDSFARSISAPTGMAAEPVKNRAAVAVTPVPGPEVMVFVRPGTDGAALAARFGLSSGGPLNADSPHIWVLRGADSMAAAAARERIATDPAVTGAFQLYPGATGRPRAFVPDDPFFFPGPNPPVGGPGSGGTATFPGKWHLVNTMPAAGNNNPAISAGVAGAWANDFTGAGITIGIVDNVVQVAHPDLQPNNAAVAALNRRYSAAGALLGTDPGTTTAGENNHGTAVAGVAAARGGNGVGVTGAAPLANLVGFNTADYAVPAVVAAYAVANGPGAGNIQVKNHSYGPSTPYSAAWQPTVAALRDSARAGTVNVIAIGNDRGTSNADGNKAFPQNSPHAVMVGALGSQGTFASYSTYGANMIVTAPSGTFTTGFVGITTADRVGNVGYNTGGATNFAAASGGGTGLDYTNTFNGTSSSAPLVAGVVAVALSANPALVVGNAATDQNTTRVVKHLLVRTSTVVDAADATATSDGGWRANAAGRSFNQNYGFGLVNATALTEQAPLFVGVTPLTSFTVATTAVNTALPDGGNVQGTLPGAFVSRTFSVAVPAADRQPIEEVLVTLGITHPFRGDLEAFIQSPSGYRSRLFHRAASDGGANINWTFTTNAFWGEQPDGTWQLDVRDVFSGDLGTWNSYSVEVRMGDLVPVPEPAGLLLAAGGLLWVRRRLASTGRTS
jgi:subtilisin-like proprotein convertase family protein